MLAVLRFDVRTNGNDLEASAAGLLDHVFNECLGGAGTPHAVQCPCVVGADQLWAAPREGNLGLTFDADDTARRRRVWPRSTRSR